MTHLPLRPFSSEIEFHSFYRHCGGGVAGNNESLLEITVITAIGTLSDVCLTSVSAQKEHFNDAKQEACVKQFWFAVESVQRSKVSQSQGWMNECSFCLLETNENENEASERQVTWGRIIYFTVGDQTATLRVWSGKLFRLKVHMLTMKGKRRSAWEIRDRKILNKRK